MTGQEEKIYTIQQVSEKIDRSIYTIGRWQKEGWVIPEYKRINGKMMRLFSEQDVKRLEEVKAIKFETMMSGRGEI